MSQQLSPLRQTESEAELRLVADSKAAHRSRDALAWLAPERLERSRLNPEQRFLAGHVYCGGIQTVNLAPATMAAPNGGANAVSAALTVRAIANRLHVQTPQSSILIAYRHAYGNQRHKMPRSFIMRADWIRRASAANEKSGKPQNLGPVLRSFGCQIRFLGHGRTTLLSY